MGVQGKLQESDQIASELSALSKLSQVANSMDSEAIFSKLHERKDQIKQLSKKNPEFSARYQAELSNIHNMIAPVDAEDFETIATMLNERKETLMSELSMKKTKKGKKSK